MLFNSLQFVLFLLIVFALYWILSRPSFRWQNAFVVAVSYVFYGWWDARFLFLILFTSLCSYASGMLISRSSRPKLFLWGNILINLAILGIFKYFDFFSMSLSRLLGVQDPILLHLILPVGISFYTFQALSYSIDVYRRDIEPTRDLSAFLAYVSFFPQLVAGPIERASSLLPQFLKPRRFDYAQAVDGLRQMLWGYFKKVVVADTCARYTALVFDASAGYSGSTLLLAAILFSFQIYGDFSGYSDIAIGCAKLFGIRLRRNFDVPYFSRNIAEFWRRWHISLTSWFRDYLYIPLGGSRGTWAETVRNTFVIFLVSGLWHGAGWNFVCWGLYHACLFLPLLLLNRNRRYRDTVASDRRLPSLKELFQMLGTFLLAAIGWGIFASDAGFVVDLFSKDLLAVPYIGQSKDLLLSAFFILLMLVVEWKNRFSEHSFSLQPSNRIVRWLCYSFLLFLIFTCAKTTESPFIYFQF